MEHHVFYSPHTDDETIGMGGAIADAKLAGHRVTLVLVTLNLPSSRMRQVFPKHSEADLITARWQEFAAAALALDVDDLDSWMVPESGLREDIVRRIVARAAEYESPTTIHHTTAPFDYTPERTTHRSHNCCAEAILSIAPRERVRLHGVYAYYHPQPSVAACWVERPLSEPQLARKRRALDCYRTSEGRIGYGYASVRELIDTAAARAVEYDYVIGPEDA